MHDASWPTCWNCDLADKDRRRLEAELRRELAPGHVLQGQPVVAKASGNHPDDVVFELPDGRLAVVHLTWGVETLPHLPWTVIYPNLTALAESDDWE